MKNANVFSDAATWAAESQPQSRRNRLFSCELAVPQRRKGNARFWKIALVASVLIGTTSALSARPLLDRAMPAPGSTVRHGPAQVELSFTEALSARGSDAVVRNSSGAIVSSGKARVTDKARMRVPVQSLPPGKYRVEWLATSSDSRQNQGSFNFVVGSKETVGQGKATKQRKH